MHRTLWTCSAVAVALLVAAAPASGQVCAPLDDGHLADAAYEGTVIYWAPVVEFERLELTISGPCEDIVKTFGSKDQVLFDIREIERITDGQYTWTLKRTATVDEGVAKNLKEARFSGQEDEIWWSLFQAGKIPAGPYTESGHFTVDRGQIIDPASGNEKLATVEKSGARSAGLADSALIGAVPSSASGDAGIATKQTISQSLCVGFDCPASPSFSDTTILMMENNTRIKFDDTSTINSFPRNDWEIEANSNANGGASYIGFNDCGQSNQGGCASDLVFAVEAGARQNALYVESDGDVGVGTSNPVVRMHMTDGDTPAMRLEQDGSSGFAPQTWDVAGNETSFFIRDATNGSTLPFRIQPGASSNRIFIASDDNVGFGTTSPDAGIHVFKSGSGVKDMVELEASTAGGRPRMTFTNGNGAWFYEVNGDNFEINRSGSGGAEEMLLEPTGDMTIGGTLTQGSSRLIKNDYGAVDPASVLATVRGLPIRTWSYLADADGTLHVGPMAEDFHAAFGLGTDDRHIAPSDQASLALAAIQGLADQVEKKDARIEELEGRLQELESLVRALTEQK